ncbi:MAG: hypothetical protein SOW64_04120 [Candidatus Enterosoma sp.]|nr:hypothetical protein [Candidatus Enterosoma sp.]
MRFLFILVPLFLFSIYDEANLSRFNTNLRDTILLIINNIDNEKLPSSSLPKEYHLICLSSCDDRYSAFLPEVRFELQSSFPYLLRDNRPKIQFTYNRQDGMVGVY